MWEAATKSQKPLPHPVAAAAQLRVPCRAAASRRAAASCRPRKRRAGRCTRR
eukprot:CAMPEP_0194730694 /NCGR_PEP_ID=MMETSP0296-20130528/53958_1 /TAXON_ID=39354 /ORGANISM="Heterosigma akashiwo, Strain CCMP2393" /LENGTH=51 /DNA_ID=CAMNT_0039637879 /DNA_START=113 /DNA_END=265 /DNA_ORIENTATION=+